MFIIGICGRAGSGKDTVADYLAGHFNFAKVAFADPMKRFAMRVFGFSYEQLWGSSEHRNHTFHADDDFWDKSSDRIVVLSKPFLESLLVQGDQLEQGVSTLYEWFHGLRHSYSGPHKLSARIVLQTLGTEYGRSFSKDIWVRYLYDVVVPRLGVGCGYTAEDGPLPYSARGTYSGVVIPDHRFANEVEYTHGHGFMIRVRRPAKEEVGNVGLAGHQSELEQLSIPERFFDVVLSFPEGIEAVHGELEKFCSEVPWVDKQRSIQSAGYVREKLKKYADYKKQRKSGT